MTFFSASAGKFLVAAMTHDRPCVAFFVNLDSKIGLARRIIFRENIYSYFLNVYHQNQAQEVLGKSFLSSAFVRHFEN